MRDWLSDPRVDVLSNHMGEPKSGGGNELRFCSPFQDQFHNPTKPDKGHHLYVNLSKGLFHCHKSSLSGTVSYLFKLLGEDVGEFEDERPTTTLDELKKRWVLLDKMRRFKQPMTELPEWYIPVRKGSSVYYYLTGRGVTDDDILYYRIGQGVGEGNENKVIIPSFIDDQCEYWVARSIDTKIYRNPTSPRRYHIGFLDLALKYSPHHLTICEGVFSAIVAGRGSVATYGKFISDYQLDRIKDAGVLHVTIALDSDAFKESMVTAKRALKRGLEVSWVELPKGKDPADIGRSAFRELVALRIALPSEYAVLKQRLRKVRATPPLQIEE